MSRHLPINSLIFSRRGACSQGTKRSIRCLMITPLLFSASFSQYPGPDGSPSGPVINTVPCRHLSGTWQDNFGAGNTYSILTDLSSNSISGTANIAHLGGSGCPRINFQISGTVTLAGGVVSGMRGTTLYRIDMTNPSVGTCNGTTTGPWTIVGELRNDGCDVGAGTWANQLNPGSGFVSIAKASDVPLGESTQGVGWSAEWPTVMQWRSTLIRSIMSRPLDGRQVFEQAGDFRDDGCYFPGAADAGFLPFQVTGAWWVVGRYATPPFFLLSDTWIDDYVGFLPSAVGYYRLNGRAPCDAYAQQNMQICTNGNGCVFSSQYKAGFIGAGITTTGVYSSRDGQHIFRMWP